MMHAYGTLPGWMTSSMIAFWLMAVALLVVAIVQLTRRPRRETPLERGQRRYATGEMNQAEFEIVRRRLRQAPDPTGTTSVA